MIDRDQYWYERAKMYAYDIFRISELDPVYDADTDPKDIFAMMMKDGFLDADQEWIADDGSD